ncbi:MAG: hypothetical protein JXA60_13600 [Candidatus Coatesbacteria bacterium]|nr:hypothetical protein [Candidatus Coatesbacteria bacterium]
MNLLLLIIFSISINTSIDNYFIDMKFVTLVSGDEDIRNIPYTYYTDQESNENAFPLFLQKEMGVFVSKSVHEAQTVLTSRSTKRSIYITSGLGTKFSFYKYYRTYHLKYFNTDKERIFKDHVKIMKVFPHAGIQVKGINFVIDKKENSLIGSGSLTNNFDAGVYIGLVYKKQDCDSESLEKISQKKLYPAILLSSGFGILNGELMLGKDINYAVSLKLTLGPL